MFGNNPYDLVAPAMLAELHRDLSAAASQLKTDQAVQSEETSLPQRIITALTSRQPSLKLAAASGESDCSEG